MVVAMWACPMYAWRSTSGQMVAADRAEGVAQVVEAERLRTPVARAQVAEPGAPERRVQRGAGVVVVEVATDDGGEHEVVRAGEGLAAAQPVERPGRLVDQRHAAGALPPFVVPTSP